MDLIQKVNGTTILLQTTNNCNNLYVESDKYNKDILKNVLSTMVYWYETYGVRYIQVKGRFGRYTSMCKYFGGLRDLERTDEEVYYFDLKIVKEVLNERHSRGL